jgi:hypothetical protein
MGGGGLERYREFAERLDGMIGALEERERPDVVLIDSRAGLHDDAAAVVTRLGAMVFLFAVGTPQTWHAYRVLFDYWRKNPAIRDVRQNLKMVSSMIPAENRDEYEKEFREASYKLFVPMYDETPPPVDAEALADERAVFNFDVGQETAPHFPLGVYWNAALQAFDPVRRPRAVPPDQVDLAYGSFVRGAAALLGITLPK